MNRLTYNYKEEYCEINAKRWNIDIEHLRKTYKGSVYLPNHNVRKEDMRHKLGQLEDIEDELGIDLITLFKGLTNGIYVKTYKGSNFVKKPFLRTDVNPHSLDYRCQDIPDAICYPILLTDYGKTWALTKEELEK